MNKRLPVIRGASIAIGLASAFLFMGARAEEMLRCGQDIVRTGDSRERVLEKCGQPKESEKYCAPVTIPEHQRQLGNVCTPGEKFTYTYEPSAIRKTVEFIDGKVYRID